MSLDSCHNFICRSSQRATPTWITPGERKGGGGSQETRMCRGKKPFPATFISILSSLRPFKREKVTLFYKYFSSSLISSQELSRIDRRWRLCPGWPWGHPGFEVRMVTLLVGALDSRQRRGGGSLAQNPLNSQRQGSWMPPLTGKESKSNAWMAKIFVLIERVLNLQFSPRCWEFYSNMNSGPASDFMDLIVASLLSSNRLWLTLEEWIER